MSVKPIVHPSKPQAFRSSQPWFKRQAQIAPYIFIAPFFILFGIFFLVPSVTALVISFFKWNGISTPEFIGMRNFQRLFTDPTFWQAVQNTGVYVFASLFLCIPLALVVASALNNPQLGMRSMWRGAFFSPIVTSSVAIALVFNLLYSTDYGLLNAFLSKFGIDKIPWLADPLWAKVSIVILIMWRWTGYVSIYLLAGMQAISQELYEAAEIDGASSTQKFLRLTLPLLRPVILYVSILCTTGSLQIFEEPYILTSGGPANATISVAQYLYNHGIGQLKFGYGSAVGVLIFITIFTLSALQLRGFGVFRED